MFDLFNSKKLKNSQNMNKSLQLEVNSRGEDIEKLKKEVKVLKNTISELRKINDELLLESVGESLEVISCIKGSKVSINFLKKEAVFSANCRLRNGKSLTFKNENINDLMIDVLQAFNPSKTEK
jgi:predicted RNase H-like nuclease (RuvC/YqgF family)